MVRAVGPTVPRWALGTRLAKARTAAGLNSEDVADAVGCSPSKIRKLEAGKGILNRAELAMILSTCGVENDGERERLFELLRLGKQRGWWTTTYGELSSPRLDDLLSFEGSASRIRSFEPLVIHGLLQTEDYARASASRVAGVVSAEEVEREVSMRMERQAHVFEDGAPPDLWVILDEAAIRRPVGGPKVMQEQLQHLLNLGVPVQIAPLSSDAYPGFAGGVTIFDFPDDLHSPIAYVECQAGNVFVEDAHEVERVIRMYEHITASALDHGPSRKMLLSVIDELRGS